MFESLRKNFGQKLAVLGTGKLGGILLRAYLRQELFSPKRVPATVPATSSLSAHLFSGVTERWIATVDLRVREQTAKAWFEIKKEADAHGEKEHLIDDREDR